MSIFTLANALKFLDTAGGMLMRVPEIKSTWDAAVSILKTDDQEVAKAGYADLMAANDEGHARLQAKLAEAEKQP